MLRNILAVIAGYVAMFILVAGGLTAAYFAMGADKAFKPGGYEITTTWLITMEAIGLFAAIVGGITCALISKHCKGAVMSLMALGVVLGAVNIAMITMAEPPTPEEQIRSDETSNMEAMMNARTPVWVAALDPFVGVIGVMIGASIVCPKRAKDESSGPQI